MTTVSGTSWDASDVAAGTAAIGALAPDQDDVVIAYRQGGRAYAYRVHK